VDQAPPGYLLRNNPGRTTLFSWSEPISFSDCRFSPKLCTSFRKVRNLFSCKSNSLVSKSQSHFESFSLGDNSKKLTGRCPFVGVKRTSRLRASEVLTFGRSDRSDCLPIRARGAVAKC
jgi:hypothetical protein